MFHFRSCIFMVGPGCSWLSSPNILSLLSSKFSSDYHKLCKYPCTVCNDVCLCLSSVRTFLRVCRVLCVTALLTWHVGQCGDDVLRCYLYVIVRLNTIVSPPSNPSRTWYRSLRPTFRCELVDPVCSPCVSFLRITLRRGQHVGGGQSIEAAFIA